MFNMKKIVIGILSLIAVFLGWSHFTEAPGIGADTVTPIAGQTYTLAGSGISSTATSFTLSSFTITQNGYKIQDSDMSEVFYVTFEPGSRSRQEIASCTTVVQNANDTATISGCTRGLSPITPYTASSSLQFAHGGGTSVIFSNPPQLYNQAAFKDNDETITGSWLFPTPLGDFNAATKEYVDSIAGGGVVSNDRLIVAGTAGETVATSTLVYFDGSDQEWKKVDTDDTATFQDKFVGLTQGNGTNAVAITGGILLKGRHTLSTGLTAGGTYYASTSAGTFSTATSALPIGQADDTNILYFDPVVINIPRTSFNNTWTGTNTFSGTVIGATRIEQVVFNASSTWTKDPGLVAIRVQAWGGGASGGSEDASGDNAGGGGGGAYQEAWFLAASTSATEAVTVGAGGASVNGTAGNNGNNTTFGSLLTVRGGSAGPVANIDVAGGNGGYLNVDDTKSYGIGVLEAAGTGGNMWGGGGGGGSDDAAIGGFAGGSAFYGGGGGGGAQGTNGTTAAGGTSIYGGNGGAGVKNGAGVAGTAPGGGGGGCVWATTGCASGRGGDGRVIVTEFY